MKKGLPSVFGLPAQRGEGVGQRVVAVQFDVAVGAQHECPLPGQEARHVAQHGDGPLVSPVQVVEHDHDGRPRRGRDDELRHGVEQAKALFVWVEPDRLFDAGQPFPQRRNQARDGRRAVAEVGAQSVGGGVFGVARDRLGKGGVGRRPLPFEAAARKYQCAAGSRLLGELLDRAGLSDAGLAHEHDERAVPRARLIELGPQPGHLLAAADERRARDDNPCTVSLVSHLTRLHRHADTLQL